MRHMRRLWHLAPYLLLLQGHRQKRELQVLVLQRPDVRQVFLLQRYRTDGSGAGLRRSAAGTGVRLLQRRWNLKPHLLLLQRHRQERELQVLVLRWEDVPQVLQLQRLGPAALALGMAGAAIA